LKPIINKTEHLLLKDLFQLEISEQRIHPIEWGLRGL
jgi:hypothetical protein